MSIRDRLGLGCDQHDEDSPECPNCAPLDFTGVVETHTLRACPECGQAKPEHEFHPERLLFNICLLCWAKLPGHWED